MRHHVQTITYPEARRCEETGEYLSEEFIQTMAYV
jgi:hypothetical protein